MGDFFFNIPARKVSNYHRGESLFYICIVVRLCKFNYYYNCISLNRCWCTSIHVWIPACFQSTYKESTQFCWMWPWRWHFFYSGLLLWKTCKTARFVTIHLLMMWRFKISNCSLSFYCKDLTRTTVEAMKQWVITINQPLSAPLFRWNLKGREWTLQNCHGLLGKFCSHWVSNQWWNSPF